MFRVTKKFKVSLSLLAVLSVSFILALPTVDATSKTVLQDLNLENVRIDLILGANGTSLIEMAGVVRNTETVPLNYFDIRVDIRTFSVLNAAVDGSIDNVELISAERYNTLRLHPVLPIAALSSASFAVKVSTTEIQELKSLNSEGDMYQNEAILYLRPTNVVNNLTFTVLLPHSGILSCDCASPVFPNPTGNFTDGTRIGFVWEREQLLPNQEIAFIIKYDMPVLAVDNTVNGAAVDLSLLFIIAGFAVGVASLFGFQKLPTVMERLRTPTILAGSLVSSQEELIIEFVKTRGGSCTQREIYRELDFSQSTASMILTSLEERGLIKRLREGRENIVHIIEE